jgi:glycosyltransferase involved in cell wall biosynthesis
MKVLQVNKFLYERAGAETVMLRTAELLEACGHDVRFFAMQDPANLPRPESSYFPPGRHYDRSRGTFSRGRDAINSVYSLRARRALRQLLNDWRPDVAHIHNVYHQLTTSVVDELASQSVPMVMTIHDYKLVCPSYTVFVDGAPCHRCVTGHPAHVIAHRCVKDSLTASVIAAAEAALTRTRGTYEKVNAFISPSEHMARVLVSGGYPRERIRVIPNFVPDADFRVQGIGPDLAEPSVPAMALFVGRLEEVKGVGVLLAAARKLTSSIEVTLVGKGPLEREVQQAHNDGVVRYLGFRNGPEVRALMDAAMCLVVPSVWEENCPMVVLEAGARGCPIVASDRGGLRELVNNGSDGLLFSPADAEALTHALERLAADQALQRRLAKARLSRTLRHHTAQLHLEALSDVYASVVVRGGQLAP